MADFEDSSDYIEAASDDASFNAEDFAITSDYDPSMRESLIGPVTSTVYQHFYEYGRRYHSYKLGRYPIPNDETECVRENIRNALFLDLLNGKLHLAPIGDQPQKILDIGTGFGDWATEMGDRYPSASVIGLDLSPIQSLWIPPNVRFVVDDIEDSTWIHGDNYDFIHFRMVSAFLKNLPRIITNVFENLKPGGWIEFQEMHPRLGCHDGTMPDDYVMDRFYRLVGAVQQRKFGWNIYAPENLPSQLERIGFVNIQRKVCHIPIGLWPKDKARMLHAFYYYEIITELLSVLRAKPFNGDDPDVDLSKEEIDTLFDEVRSALVDKRVHAYIPFHVIWAQKPLESPT